MRSDGHRRVLVLRGDRAHTSAEARRRVAALDGGEVVWAGADGPIGALVVPAGRARKALGRSVDCAVIDGHDGLSAEALGQVAGCVRGGGTLVLRLDAGPGRDRFHRRLDRVIEAHASRDPGPIGPGLRAVRGTPDQAHAVDALRRVFGEPSGCASLTADRGRGKSAALGLALSGLADDESAAVTGPDRSATDEVRRFTDTPFVSLDALIDAPGTMRVIAVDEAAQVPVPTLRRLVEAHPTARFAFATTVRGYEGTGRGFVLRFLAWLEGRGEVEHLTLDAPIRWAADDPVERFVFDALLLDAAPSGFDDRPSDLTPTILDRDRLVADEAQLRAVFGLLVHAHYRTTPSDLQRLLDSPDMRLHAMLDGRGRVAAVNLLAVEGGLTPAVCDGLYRGRTRIRGHALVETLAADAGRPDVGGMSIVRSVRIATHPALRRLGLARRLTDHVHACHDPDLFGTLFGATPALLQFRRSMGYRLVRVGVSGGRRAGEPAAVMIRPISGPARALVGDVRGALARDLPRQLELMATDQHLAPSMVSALMGHGATPRPLDVIERDRLVASFAFGPRPLETVAGALGAFLAAHSKRLDVLDPPARALIEGRVLRAASWRVLARDRGGVRGAMRAVRRAVRALCLSIDPAFADRM